MRIPKLNLCKYQKSLYKTQKVKRTVSPNRSYIQKEQKQQTKREQELQEYLKKQKELEIECTEKMNNALMDIQAQDIIYNALLLYGIKVNKEKIIEILKARKAK